MGGSRRPRSDQHFIAVRDGELHNAQSALKALAKDVTLLHSTQSQTMLFLGCLLGDFQDLNLLGFYGLHNIWAKPEGFRSQPSCFTAAKKKPGVLEFVCKCSSSELM